MRTFHDAYLARAHSTVRTLHERTLHGHERVPHADVLVLTRVAGRRQQTRRADEREVMRHLVVTPQILQTGKLTLLVA